jgi:hypothetical protein
MDCVMEGMEAAAAAADRAIEDDIDDDDNDDSDDSDDDRSPVPNAPPHAEKLNWPAADPRGSSAVPTPATAPEEAVRAMASLPRASAAGLSTTACHQDLGVGEAEGGEESGRGNMGTEKAALDEEEEEVVPFLFPKAGLAAGGGGGGGGGCCCC